MDREQKREKLNIDWVVMNMRLSGSNIDEEKAVRMVTGDYVLDATLEEHLLINNLTEMIPLMYDLFGMEEELSAGTLNKFYRTISGGEKGVYRKTTPVLFHLSYNPVLPQEIEEELRRLFSSLHDGKIKDPLKRAVFVHDNLMRIYPFDRYTEIIARTAMEYELLYSGLSMYPLTLTESEYNRALTEFFKRGSENVILENLRLNKLMEESRI